MLSHLWTNVAYLRPILHSCNIFLIFFQVLSMMMMTTTPPDFQGLISSRPWLKWKSFNENWVSNFFSESGFCWISQLQFPNINPWESHDGIEIWVYAFSCQDFYSNLERYFLILSRRAQHIDITDMEIGQRVISAIFGLWLGSVALLYTNVFTANIHHMPSATPILFSSSWWGWFGHNSSFTTAEWYKLKIVKFMIITLGIQIHDYNAAHPISRSYAGIDENWSPVQNLKMFSDHAKIVNRSCQHRKHMKNMCETRHCWLIWFHGLWNILSGATL